MSRAKDVGTDREKESERGNEEKAEIQEAEEIRKSGNISGYFGAGRKSRNRKREGNAEKGACPCGA